MSDVVVHYPPLWRCIPAATAIAWKMYGKPYLWPHETNGWRGKKFNDPGVDCSGFVSIILKETGALPVDAEKNAHNLWKHFENKTVTGGPHEGCLIFYGQPDKVSHVMYCLNEQLCIGAVNGGSKCTSVEISYIHDARVSVRKINQYRPEDIIAIVNPYMEA